MSKTEKKRNKKAFTQYEQNIIDQITNLNDLHNKITDQKKQIYAKARKEGIDTQKIKDYIKATYKKTKK